MQVAQAKGLPGLKHHLLPRTKGFAITVRSLRNVGKDDPAGPRAVREGDPGTHRSSFLPVPPPTPPRRRGPRDGGWHVTPA